MAMQEVKKGARPTSEVKVRISERAKTISFSSGFVRKYKLSQETHTHVRLGYDTVTKEIGVEFCKDRPASENLMKLSYTASKTAASCPVRPILNKFDLQISNIAGDYLEGKAINAEVPISGFAKSGFLLDTKKAA